MKNKPIASKIDNYIKIPMYLLIYLVVVTVPMFFLNTVCASVMCGFDAAYGLIALLIYIHNKSAIAKDLLEYAMEQGQIQEKIIKELPVPYAILDMDGKILWANDSFCQIIGEDKKYKKAISNYFPSIVPDIYPTEKNQVELQIGAVDKHYRVRITKMELELANPDAIMQKRVAIKKFSNKKNDNTPISAKLTTVMAVHFFDETELHKYIIENRNQRLVAGLIYIDNYEETLEGIEDVRRSLLVALVDRKVNKYMQNIDAIVKKIATDKYIVVFQQKHLGELQNNKFSLLDEVRELNIGNEQAVTISISLGVNGDGYQQSYEYARMAMDMALGRGGNQAVMKDREKISYYGGKVQVVERNTRVKARVKAHALREIMETKEKIVIMGHSYPDVDAIGSAVGIYRMAKTLGKRAYIVVNETTFSVRPIMNTFIGNSIYEEDMFIDNETAEDLVDSETLLVVVDVNRPSYTQCPILLNMTKTVVVIDHHRQTSEIIENPVLSYVEPFASSASEMVAEILQYAAERPNLRSNEADALYGGILIDTDNFVTKTGVRTFEAAAYLRRNGADVVRVRKMFRNDMNTYRARANAVKNAEIFMEAYAISIFKATDIDSPTVVAAQVANALLDISGIKASFVVTDMNGTIYVSARSIDELNVQLVMEHFDGGGHASVAGAQLHDCTADETVSELKDVLKTMIEEGEI